MSTHPWRLIVTLEKGLWCYHCKEYIKGLWWYHCKEYIASFYILLLKGWNNAMKYNTHFSLNNAAHILKIPRKMCWLFFILKQSRLRCFMGILVLCVYCSINVSWQVLINFSLRSSISIRFQVLNHEIINIL